MASTGNVFAGTGENNNGIGATAWTSPTSVTADDGTDATCNAGASSQYLVARNFDFSSIPNDAVITGITVRAEASEHSAGTESLNAQLQDASGTLTGSSQSQTISGTTKAVYTYGSTTDVWGATLTPAVVKDADFGVRFWFTTAHDVRVDFVTMAVEYQLPPTPKTKTAAPQQTKVREVAGFAVAFIAAAAHIPPPAGTDAIGAAQYTSGTHQAALAERQPKPWVRGTPSALIPGPAVVDSPATRIIVTIPQRPGESDAQVFHALIPDVAPSRLISTGPQSAATPQPEITKALIPEPVVIDSPGAKPIIVGPQRQGDGAGQTWRALIPSDTLQTRLITAAPQRAGDLQASVSKALIPEPVVGTDVIGAANFTVGTHRPTQVTPSLFRSLIPATVAGTDVQFTRLITAAPQRVPSGSAQVYGQQPASVEERLFNRYYEADQQLVRQPQPYFARVKIDAPQADSPKPKTLLAQGSAVQQPQPVFAKALIEALPISTPQLKTLLSGQWERQQPQPILFQALIEALPVHTPNARTLYAHQQVLEQRPARIFGRLVVEVVADTPIIRFVSAAPQADSRNGSQVWHARISEVAFSARFVCVAPQTSVDGRGWIKSPASAYQVQGTDTAVGRFSFADQRFVPIQYAIASRISVSWQVAGGRVATFEAGFDDVFFGSKHDDVYFEPTAFDITQFDAKEA